MKSNIINNLTVQFNQQLYTKDEIYITIGIKFGFCTNKILVLPQNEIKEINQASADVFISYIDIIMKEKYKAKIRVNAKTSMIYISIKSKKDKMDEDLRLILKTLYEDEVNEEVFIRAKKESKSKFSYNYKKSDFRAYYRMMEFSNINKNFNLIKFTKDFLNINFEMFKTFFENIVVVQNSILFINGDLSNLQNSKIFEAIQNIKATDNTVMIVAEGLNKALQSDVHLIDSAKEEFHLGGINFSFF